MNGNENGSRVSKSFYFLIGAGIAGLVGSFYYLYSLFNEEIELDEEQELMVEKISEEVSK